MSGKLLSPAFSWHHRNTDHISKNMQNVKKSEVKTYWRKKCFLPFYSFFLFFWLIEWFEKIWESLWTQNETFHVHGVWSIFRNLGYIKIFSQHAWRLLGSLKKVPSVILSSNLFFWTAFVKTENTTIWQIWFARP